MTVQFQLEQRHLADQCNREQEWRANVLILKSIL